MKAAPMVGVGRIWPIDWSHATPLRPLPLFVYNYRLRLKRNCSLFLSKNIKNLWLSITYLDLLFYFSISSSQYFITTFVTYRSTGVKTSL